MTPFTKPADDGTDPLRWRFTGLALDPHHGKPRPAPLTTVYPNDPLRWRCYSSNFTR